jgi:salicylate hydroxylase
MQANANRVLDSLGVYELLLTICIATPFGPSRRRYKDGEFLIKKPAEVREKEYGYPYVVFINER